MKMKFLDLIKKRYASKLFDGQKIPQKDFNKILEAIRLSPSSFNLQPWKIKIVEDRKILEKLEKASYDQKQIGTCSHLLVFCAVKNLEKNKDKLFLNMENKMPGEKFVEYEKRLNDFFAYTSKENLFKLSGGELFIALENAMLCTTDLGYASCPIGGFEVEKYKKILNIPENLTPIVICPIGIPLDNAREKFRFSEKEIFF